MIIELPASSIQDDFILEAKGLHVHFPVGRSLPWERKQYVHAVDGVSLGVRKGETLAVVGESGSGKTTLCRALVGLIKPSGGNVLYNGEDLQQFVKGETIKLQGKVQMVFQDPDSSLNPFMKVGEIVAEPISRTELAKSEIGDRAVQTLELVGLGREIVDRRAVELSGGQKQRVSIARAIISNPDVVTLDEPSSALDVAVQSQILNLLVDLQKLYGLGYILVTHNISVAQFLSDRIAVMYAGKIQELGATRTVMSQPLHPYTMTLIEATPLPDPKVRNLLRINVKGEPPSALNPPSGCRFHPRCPFVQKRCETEEPTLRGIMPDHFAACHFAEDVQKKLKPG